MHLRFSFFRIWAITIRSRENHVFPRLCPRITQQRKKENFWDFFPMDISEISVSSAQFQADSCKSLLHINLYWLPIQNTMTLYNFALKLSSALKFAPGIYLSEYYVRCKYGCNRSPALRSSRRSAHFPIGSNAKLSPHFLHPQELWVSAKHIHV